MSHPSTKYDFDAARQRIKTIGISESDGPCSLADIGESLACYVPRLVRNITVSQLIGMSHEQLAQHYDFGSWAIGDLVLLLTRLADDYGYVPQAGSSEVPSADFEPNGRQIESDRATTEKLVMDGMSSDRGKDGSGRALSEAGVETNLCDWERAFEECRSVLALPTSHRHLDEPLSEFVEPGDVDLPIGFLHLTVRDALERPIEY